MKYAHPRRDTGSSLPRSLEQIAPSNLPAAIAIAELEAEGFSNVLLLLFIVTDPEAEHSMSGIRCLLDGVDLDIDMSISIQLDAVWQRAAQLWLTMDHASPTSISH